MKRSKKGLRRRYGRGLADRNGPHAPTYRGMVDHDGFSYLWHNGAYRLLKQPRWARGAGTNASLRREIAAMTGEPDPKDFHLSFDRKR